MQSSGASTLALLLAQKPDCSAFADIWAMYAAPALSETTDDDVVAKVVITTSFPLALHQERFRPDRTILFLRHPWANYRSLASKRYRHHCGFMEEKFAVMNQTFVDNSAIDLTLYYEDLIFDPLATLSAVTQLGWECDADFLNFHRSQTKILKDNEARHPSVVDRLEYGFGNHHSVNLTSAFANLRDLENSESPVSDWCPDVTQHYRALMEHNREKWVRRRPPAEVG
jgi:hypothetical protein